MRRLLLAASFAAIAAVPAVSQAQSTACEREQRSDRVAGTVVGGVAGALLGSAIAGNSSNTEGTIIGGVAGAIAGNQIAKSGNPCPPGYRAVAQPGYAPGYNSAPGYAPGYNAAPGYAPGYNTAPGYGAAPGYNTAPGYGTAPAYGYNDDYRTYYDERGGWNRDRFWAGAPNDVYERIAFLEQRVRRGAERGTITPREADRVYASLSQVRREATRFRRDRYGRFNARDEAYLQDRLDRVSQQVQWARANDNRRYR